jgi:hypothetical protein
MGLNAVQLHANDITSGITTPLYNNPLVTFIVPPNPGELTGPTAYIWVTMGDNKRSTAPRGAGFRKMMWTVSMWIMSPDNVDNPNANSAFASLIDAIIQVWVTTPMPVPLTDSVTGAVSQLVSIGEDFHIEQSPVHQLANQQLVLYEALIEFSCREDLVP